MLRIKDINLGFRDAENYKQREYETVAKGFNPLLSLFGV